MIVIVGTCRCEVCGVPKGEGREEEEGECEYG